MDKPKPPPGGFKPGETYRFRTLVADAICMDEPAGTEFSVDPGNGRVVFAGRKGPSGMGCSSPAYWMACGQIEWLPDVYGNEEDE